MYRPVMMFKMHNGGQKCVVGSKKHVVRAKNVGWRFVDQGKSRSCLELYVVKS